MNTKFKLQHKLFGLFTVFAIIISGLITLIFYHAAYTKVHEDIRHRLRDIVSIAAANIDLTTYAKLQKIEQEGSESYRAIKTSLQKIRDASTDIFYIYTMRYDSNQKITFVVDAETDPAKIAHLGETYDDASPLLREKFHTMAKPIVETDFYTDQWGTWLSGYAPLFLSDNSRSGVLGVDISADTVMNYKKKFLQLSLMIFLFTLPIFCMAGYLIGHRIAAPVIRMKEGAEKIGQGQLETHIDIKRKDELGTLADTLNDMAYKLHQSHIHLNQMVTKYKSIFDNSVEGIFQTTMDGRILTVNNAFMEMLGYPSLDDILQSISELETDLYANARDREIMVSMLKNNQNVKNFEVSLKRKDGTFVWVEMNAHIIHPENEQPIIDGILHDITERREKELAEKKRHVAEASSRAKSEFLANMSHEIRTPLNAITGLTDLVMRTELAPKQQGYLKKIKTASSTLLAVINDILDFSKIEAGKLELEETDFSLYEVIANLSEMFAQTAQEKEIEFLVSIDESVPSALRGDPVRLGQILINLTGNALKFTEKGEIVLSVRNISKEAHLQEQKAMLEFSIKDTGIGIDQERLGKIFDSFTQADTSTTRKHGGTGLGLSISTQLTKLMHGDISVASIPGKGTTFTFTLLFKTQPKENQINFFLPKDMRGLRVLIVDDNATAREILSRSVSCFEMKNIAVGSGEEAIEVIKKEEKSFDLILMDWNLPKMSGIETAKFIKQRMKLEKTPLICLITAYGREDLIQAEKAFIDAFMQKPINQSFLFDTIVGLFGSDISSDLQQNAVQMLDTIDQFPDLKGTRLLLVEDNAINQEIAQEWLKSASIDVEIADTGKKAVIMAGAGDYDGILMDIQLPEMDGYQATEAIRKDPRLSNIPIIAMTAHALKGDREKCLTAGMNDYVSKPIDPQKMFATLLKWIEKKSDQPLAKVAALKEEYGQDSDQTLSRLSTGKEEQNDTFFELDLPGIEIKTGLYRAMNKASLYKKLLKTFMKDFDNTLDDMVAFFKEKDYKSLRGISHSVKGVAGNIGAVNLSEKAAAMEQAAQAKNISEDAQIWKEYIQSFQTVMDGLKQNFADEDFHPVAENAEVMDISKESLLQKCHDVIIFLNDDIQAAEELIKKITGTLRERVGNREVDALLSSIEEFDIDASIALMNKMIGQIKQ